MTLEKSARESPFLRFANAEYRRRGTQLRRDLSNKTYVHSLLEHKTLGGARLGLPTQHAVLHSTEEITAEVLGDRVALKFAHGWSAKGVMLLERVGEDRYFDNMALREWTLEEIREKQQAVAAKFTRKDPAWIVEEFLHGAQPGTVPFDYKFYVFQGQIAMVAQIDRNTSPPRMVKLDGDLKPFSVGRDYFLRLKDIQPGAPVVPRSAVMLSRWAIELSKMTDAPFVRVDLYDTVDGPYFGEFTFSSGAEVRGTVTYSDDMLARFDHLFLEARKRLNGEEAEPLTGWSKALQDTEDEVLASYPLIGLTAYQRFAHFLYNRGSLGGFRLAEAQSALLESGEASAINTYLCEAHMAAGRRARVKTAPLVPALLRVGRKVYRKLRQVRAQKSTDASGT
ncbi:ATP-grasp fold amidoligase family protein [Nesterenkonia sp. Act20]|uniref:ATP-grasp fold amidoligase family protein n=1 Tax=Nesterenkonia sp. Act20 TaxID=1483432 RepID=UPI001C4677FF|nr:ATP-grasp fold amidoligase family protein [Nesterenkonia sp. Act20]